MITVINFSDDKFRSKQRWNTFTARFIGKANHVIEYRFNNLNTDLIDFKNPNFIKGCGNYFWKPYIINDALKNIKLNDYLFYSDSGSIFMKNLDSLVSFLEFSKKDVLCFSAGLIEKQWTKRDSFILMKCDSPAFTLTKQVMGTFLLIKKSEASEKFIKSFLNYSKDKRILTDDENQLGKKNYTGFIAHRHDQSILSLLAKKNKDVVVVEGDLSDYGYFPNKYLSYASNVLFDAKSLDINKNRFKGMMLLNRRQHPFIYLIKYLIKRMLLKLNLLHC